MEVELVEKVSRIYKEIQKLKKYKHLQQTNKNSYHFKIIAHFGIVTEDEEIYIPRKHNSLFTEVLDGIISQLEKDLKKL